MKISFLGTGTSQGVPVIACGCEVCKSQNEKDKRLRSSILIEVDNKTIVVDTGPDFRQQMLRSNVQKLDAVILTHEHKDHIGGMDDIRAFNFKQKKSMNVYCSKEVSEGLKREFFYAFAERKYPGVPQINIIEIENKTFKINELEIIPIKGKHFKLDVFGYRIGDFAYITDVNYIPKKELEKLKGLKTLVLCALRKQKHYSHFSLDEALELIRQLKPKQGYLTHVSHVLGLHNEVQKELPKNVFLAWDGLEIVCCDD